MHIGSEFIKGINYWPASKAMYWWKSFDENEVRRDFCQMARFHIRLIRIFLTWEDFQPEPDNIPRAMLDNLKLVADIALKYQIQLMPTFFCGHMSGVNWMPHWMLEETSSVNRFPVYSGYSLVSNRIRNFYSDHEIIAAQKWQLEQVGQTLKEHPAVWGYDLGNESSNCAIPADRIAARNWLEAMTAALRKYGDKPITLGMHAEDLEEDRNLWPQDAALYCDFLCMHGYPFYLRWASYDDINVLPFLAIVTNWLGNKPVLFQEFGLPTQPIIEPTLSCAATTDWRYPLWTETEGLAYYNTAMNMLKEVTFGAMGWCYADYSPLMWNQTPLDVNPHERHFGVFRHDGTPKPAVQTFMQNLASYPYPQVSADRTKLFSNIKQEDYYADPAYNIQKLYQRYHQNVFIDTDKTDRSRI